MKKYYLAQKKFKYPTNVMKFRKNFASNYGTKVKHHITIAIV